MAVVPLIFTAAACGSSDSGSGAKASASQPAASGVKVSGALGAKPTVAFPAGTPATKSSFEVINEGTGPGVKVGDSLMANLTIYDWDGKQNAFQGSSYDSKQPENIVVNEQLPKTLQDAFGKVKHGGRMLYVMASEDGAQQQGPTKVFVFDVVGPGPTPSPTPTPPANAPKAASGKETSESIPGVKLVNPGGDKAPTLTTKTSEKAPKGLVVKTVIKGTGKPVKPEQSLLVHYTGKIWGTDAEFDSSWGRGEPASFPLSGVIQGWQKGLAGVPVGSRVVMSIPPDMGYGAQEQQGIPANSTLVFVVDVLAAY
ncbi:FKBP-type peptidyl-prolyl cis-trans isomerase [Nonomuraea sp. NBC_01738]|uniref:FKBP-type peptidyl-prolyl cis-trans isomerase n=1 Tax=Nonomuraea sp. NBC_01738 TaxID=2976003 RepID=UPI002E129BE4|nr:FKBP-type peptidyl-prolyl cis-trans isomerase [Nonomuraea sp. NBC_01738]